MELIARLPHIYDVATSKTNWEFALTSIGEGVNATGAMIYSTSNTEFPYEVSTTNKFFIDKMDKVSTYFERYSSYDQEAIFKIFASPIMQPITDLDVWPDLDLEKGRVDVDFVREELGVFRRIGFNISTEKSWNAALCLQYDHQYPIIKNSWVKDTGFLLPHLAKATELNRFFSQLLVKYNAALSVLDNVNIGLCVVSPTAEILISNHMANVILDQRDGLHINRYNTLVAKNDDVSQQIKQSILLCADTANGEHNTFEETISVSRDKSEPPLLMEVTPLRDGDSELENNLHGGLLLLIDPDNPPKLSTGPLKKMYSLTDTEVEIANLLIEGHQVSSIAEMRNKAPDTIKNQCRSIYQKIGVSNRAQLIRKIVALSPPIL